MDAASVVYSLQRHLTLPGSFRRSEIGAMDHAEAVDPQTVQGGDEDRPPRRSWRSSPTAPA